MWRAIAWTPDELLARASAWRDALGLPGVDVVEARSAVGGGTLPGVTLPTFALALPPGDPDGVAARLRAADPPVVARIDGGRVLLDPRTVLPGEDEAVLAAVRGAVAGRTLRLDDHHQRRVRGDDDARPEVGRGPRGDRVEHVGLGGGPELRSRGG